MHSAPAIRRFPTIRPAPAVALDRHELKAPLAAAPVFVVAPLIA